jgi:hypothetical protein
LKDRGLTLFIYTAYTFPVISDIELPELLSSSEAQGNDAVTVQVAKQPPEPQQGDSYAVRQGYFYLNLVGLASYEVRAGRTILIRLAEGADLREVRLFLLGTCFGMVLHQRGSLAFHASSVVTARGAVLFTGPSGIGKSTLLYTLTKLGYPMLADDVTGIRVSAGRVVALPSFPRSKLRDDSARTLGLEPKPEDVKVPNLDKTQLDLRRDFYPQSVGVDRIYHLNAAEAHPCASRQKARERRSGSLSRTPTAPSTCASQA